MTLDEMNQETQKPRAGFVYLDLNSGNYTGGFRPEPVSRPQDVYIALLGRDESCNPLVKEVYKLIGKPDPRIIGGAKFVKSKVGKNLAVRVARADVIKSLKKYHEHNLGPKVFSLNELCERENREDDLDMQIGFEDIENDAVREYGQEFLEG